MKTHEHLWRSRWILLRIGNVSDKFVKKIKTHDFMFNENRAIYKKIWKNIVEPETPQMTIARGPCALHAGYLRQQTHT